MGAGKTLLFKLAELEKFTGNYHWVGSAGTVSIEDLRSILFQIGALTAARNTSAFKPRPRGQPRKVWHGVARAFADLVVAALQEIGCEKKGTNPKEAASATAVICAEALSWAYAEEITAEAFVSALRPRYRSKKSESQFSGDLEQRFPDAARVVISK